MGFFNFWGLVIVTLILFPNIIYGFKHQPVPTRDVPKYMIVLENIGRYGCMLFLIADVPFTYSEFFIPNGLIYYLAINGGLVLLYIILYFVFWKRTGLAKGLWLSIIPSLIFLYSGIMILSIPLLICAALFATCHILISVRQGLYEERQSKETTSS